MHIDVSFAGGSEMLFNDKRDHSINIPEGTDVRGLIDWITNNLVVDRDKLGLLFVDGDVRPGILLLVNDVDWEITGGLDTELHEKDNVTFISTLHGG